MDSWKRAARAEAWRRYVLARDEMGDIAAEAEAHGSEASDESEEARQRKNCLLKVRYATSQEAEEAAGLCTRLGTISVEAYACPYCGGWHLTARPWRG